MGFGVGGSRLTGDADPTMLFRRDATPTSGEPPSGEASVEDPRFGVCEREREREIRLRALCPYTRLYWGSGEESLELDTRPGVCFCTVL